jgi:putative YphP/YqiW family bacilliredoxin
MFGLYNRNLMLQGMRDELTGHGFMELGTPAEVDAALADTSAPTLLMINSVCGCAAGAARPGVVLSLNAEPRPARLLTVFAGQDREATERARGHLVDQPASSPAVALLRDGEVVFMLHRGDIEGQSPEQVAQRLRAAYATFCA